jgi:hypothetical protein
MTGKDILKILLCLHGYDRNVKVESYRGEGNAIGYEVYAENAEGDSYEEINCDGLMFHISQILDYMKENNVDEKTAWWHVTSEYAYNDSKREKIVEAWDKYDKEIAEMHERSKPLTDWLTEHRPCPLCTDNPHDLDWANYQCSHNYHNNCPKLVQFRTDYDKFRQEWYNKQKK